MKDCSLSKSDEPSDAPPVSVSPISGPAYTVLHPRPHWGNGPTCGKVGAEIQSRRPHRTNAVGEQVQQEVLRLRAQHGWGPHRLSFVLRAEGISVGHTTVYTILKKHGRIPMT